jgi:dTMP kinase
MRGNGDGASRGLFITFEGADGAGKSTHLHFLAAQLEKRGREVVCLREPGGTALGERVRSVVLDPALGDVADEAELFLYEAARAQLTAEVIEPAMQRGAVVLSDRFFDSTVAYQGFGRGLDRAFIDAANAFAARGIVPDRTLLFVTGEGAAADLARAAQVARPDRLELAGVAFHERVEDGFARIAAAEPDRVHTVVSAGAPSQTARRVLAALSDVLPELSDGAAPSDADLAALDRAVADSAGEGGASRG